MAGEFMVINPRHRRRSRGAGGRFKAGRAKNPRKRRRRLAARNPVNPRRRRRRSRRHYLARNPRVSRGMNLAGIDVGAAAITAGGFIGAGVGAKFLVTMLPPDWQSGPNAPLARIGLKAVVGVGVPILARRFIGARMSNLLAAGGAVAVLIDAWQTWLAPAMGLGEYEAGMLQDYETGGAIEGLSEVESGGAYGGNIYG